MNVDNNGAQKNPHELTPSPPVGAAYRLLGGSGRCAAGSACKQWAPQGAEPRPKHYKHHSIGTEVAMAKC